MLVRQALAQYQQQFFVIPRFAQVLVDLPFVDRLDDGVQVGVTGEQDAPGLRVFFPHPGEQMGAVHAGHARIAHHQVDTPLREDFQGLGATGGQQHLIGLGTQQALEAVENRFFVVHQQHTWTLSGLKRLRFFHGALPVLRRLPRTVLTNCWQRWEFPDNPR